MTIKRHEAMTCSGRSRFGRQTKKFTCDFSFANSCRQINIFCAKFIISSHFATMAIGSANPVADDYSAAVPVPVCDILLKIGAIM